MRKSNLCYTLLIHIINDLLDTGRKSTCIRHSEDVLKLKFIKKESKYNIKSVYQKSSTAKCFDSNIT